MSFLTLRKIPFRIGCSFCIIEYAKNVNNIRYDIAMTFQLHSKLFMKEHAYITNHHNEMIWWAVIGEKSKVRTGRRVTFLIIWSHDIYLRLQLYA